MNTLVVASIGKGTGKTSLILGLAKVYGKPFGYLKPLGDRMIYREKKVWDYDADLIATVFGLERDPEEMTIGFEHAKLRYMYDEVGRRKKLHDMAAQIGKDLLFVEGGLGLRYGVSIGLDPISLAKDIGGRLLIVIGGHEDTLFDDATYLKKYLDMTGVSFIGVIFNKVQNMDDFKTFYLPRLSDLGIRVLGTLPYEKELTYLTVGYLARRLFAKVITGEQAMNRVIKNILVGAMSINALFQTSLFQKEDKLVITSGDRADMILAAIETNAACVVITNNIVPTSNIISKAYEKNIPMLMVPQDTYQVSTRIDNIEPLITRDDTQKIDRTEHLVREHVNWKEILNA